MKPTEIDRNTELEFFNNLLNMESEAIDMLHVSNSTSDPVLQAKAIAQLRRVCFDFFIARYLKYVCQSSGKPAYIIDYSYWQQYQNGEDFSVRKVVEEIRDNTKPVEIGISLFDES